MNEPRRLLDETESSVERALLNAGRAYRSSPATRTKALIALGLVGSAALTGAGSASASVLAKSVWTKILAVSSLGAVAAIPVAHELWDTQPSAHPVPASVSPARPANPTGFAETGVLAESGELGAALEEQEPAASPIPSPPAARAPAPVVSPSSATRRSAAALTDELAALDAARSTLSSGDAKRALHLLDGYGRSHPNGRLRVEAEVLRIDAMAKSGQRGAAKKRAEAFLKRHPNSVLATRVRTYL